MKIRWLPFVLLFCLSLACTFLPALAGDDLAAAYFPDYVLQQEVREDAAARLLMRRPDGAIVFIGGVQAADGTWTFAESSPLPDGAVFSIDSPAGALSVRTNTSVLTVTLSPFADGTWGVAEIIAGDGQTIRMGRTWISCSTPLKGVLGDHPWSNIADIDWQTLPADYEAAAAGVDCARWGVISADQTVLLSAPEPGAYGYGHYMRGVPLCIREFRGDYARVLIGHESGWMHLSQFALNVDISSVPPAQAVSLPAGTALYTRSTASADSYILSGKDTLVYLLGLHYANDMIPVWLPETDHYAYVKRDAASAAVVLPGEEIIASTAYALAAPTPVPTVHPDDPQFPNYTLIDSAHDGDKVYLLMRGVNGQLVFVGGVRNSRMQWDYSAVSATLPQGTILGAENFTTSLLIPCRDGGSFVVTLEPYQHGKWGICFIAYRDNPEIRIGPNYVSDMDGLNYTTGSHPWDDINAIDWDCLPKTVKEAISQMENPHAEGSWQHDDPGDG